MRYIFLTILLIISSQLSLTHALDVSDFTYRHFSMHDGMSSQRVFSLRQTADGVVWWTTKCGVDRTNGSRIVNYQLEDTSDVSDHYSSFGGRVVKFAHGETSLLQDDKILVFNNAGRIFRYDALQDKFVLYCNISGFFSKDFILKDLYIADGCFYVAMREGVYRLFSSSEKDAINGFKLELIRKDIYANQIASFRDGKLLVCTKDGVFVMSENPKGRNDFHKISPLNTESVYYDTETKLLWIGSYSSSVKVLNTEKNYDVVMDMQSCINSNPVRRIVPYDSKTMLIGVDGYGVYSADRHNPASSTNTLHSLFSTCADRTGILHGNGVYDVLIDNCQDIFVGTYSGGIDIARPVGCTVAKFCHVPGSCQSLINDHVNTVKELDPNRLLMGTDNGISVLDMSTKTWNNYVSGRVVLDVCRSPITGKLLAATYGCGVLEIDANGNVIPLFTKENGQIPDNHVYSLLFDNDNNLWMGSILGKLAVKCPSGMKYYDVCGVNSLTLLHNGTVAVGTNNGLYIVDQKNDNVDRVDYRVDGNDDTNLVVQDVHESSDNSLWIGTDGGGVYVYSISGTTFGSVCQLTTNDGLPSNNVCNITEDATGRVWFATERGLAFTHQEDPTNVVNVNYGYGLQTEYVRGSVTNLSNGNFLYGTVYGAQIINPLHIQRLNYETKLYIRGVLIKEGDTTRVMPVTDRLDLNYDQRSFSIFFEGVNQRHYYDLAYQYKIGDAQWSLPNDDTWKNFENLEPGRHTLYIRCVSNSCKTVLDTKEIEIIISQPWWNSWWMWIVYVTLIGLAFYGAWLVYDLHARYMALVLKTVKTDNGVTEPIVQKTNVERPPVITVEKEHKASIGREEEMVNEREQTIFVEKVTNIVLENLDDIGFNIDSLCSKMAMSRTLFYVKLKTYTGKSPQDFVRIIKLEKAASLLRKGYSVTDVSMMVGFDNPKYFSTVFKKYFQISPSKFE